MNSQKLKIAFAYVSKHYKGNKRSFRWWDGQILPEGLKSIQACCRRRPPPWRWQPPQHSESMAFICIFLFFHDCTHVPSYIVCLLFWRFCHFQGLHFPLAHPSNILITLSYTCSEIPILVFYEWINGFEHSNGGYLTLRLLTWGHCNWVKILNQGKLNWIWVPLCVCVHAHVCSWIISTVFTTKNTGSLYLTQKHVKGFLWELPIKWTIWGN